LKQLNSELRTVVLQVCSAVAAKTKSVFQKFRDVTDGFIKLVSNEWRALAGTLPHLRHVCDHGQWLPARDRTPGRGQLSGDVQQQGMEARKVTTETERGKKT